MFYVVISLKRNHGTFDHAAVAADNEKCSEIGLKTLKKGGNAVDATIATSLCIGVVHSQSSGLGGGGFMTIYDAKSGTQFLYVTNRLLRKLGIKLTGK